MLLKTLSKTSALFFGAVSGSCLGPYLSYTSLIFLYDLLALSVVQTTSSSNSSPRKSLEFFLELFSSLHVTWHNCMLLSFLMTLLTLALPKGQSSFKAGSAAFFPAITAVLFLFLDSL